MPKRVNRRGTTKLVVWAWRESAGDAFPSRERVLFQVRNCSRWSEAAPFNTHSYAAVRLTMAPEAYICFIRGGRGWSGDSQYRQIQAIKSNSKGMIYVNVKCAERGRGAARNSPHAQSPFCRFSPRKRKGTQRAPLATRNNLAKGPSSRSIG